MCIRDRHKTETVTQFIDASGEEYFKKEANNNVMQDKHIQLIMDAFDSKDDVDHVALVVDKDKIARNDYNLSVSSYVEARNTREVIDITKLNAEIEATVGRIDQLRAEIDSIVLEIEG